LPAKTIFASWFFPPYGKNLPTLPVTLDSGNKGLCGYSQWFSRFGV